MKKIAVVLSGCGYLDGSEITEAVATLIALSQLDANVQCFAPVSTFTAIDHLESKNKSGERQVLNEAARIARGQVKDVAELTARDFDAVIFPGGYGVASNLSSWAREGSRAKVLPEVERVIREFYQEQKPIGAICIAPTLVARVLGSRHVTLTIGNDPETAAEIEKTGARHEPCSVDDYVSDRDHKVVTTPAYMFDHAKPNEVFKGVFGLCKEIFEMA